MTSALRQSRYTPVGMVVIHDEILAADQASFDVPNIPQGYRHLLIELSARGTNGSATRVYARYNNDSGNNYRDYERADSGSPSSALTDAGKIGWVPGTDAAAGTAASMGYTLRDYAGELLWKSAELGNLLVYGSGPTVEGHQVGHMWQSLAAISRVTLLPGAGSFAAGSRLTVYGIGGAPVGSVDAADVAVADVGGFFASADVEAVLQELGLQSWDGIVVKEVTESVSSSTTVQADDELFFAMVNGGAYEFKAVIVFDEPANSGTPDFKWRFAPASGSQIAIRRALGIDTSFAIQDTSVVDSNDLSNIADGNKRTVQVEGSITAFADTDYQLQWAQDASSANAVRVLAGSYLAWRRIA